MKKNRNKIIIISSIILIILGIIIGSTRALSTDILVVCDKTELLPNESTTCHVSGVTQKSISAIEFYMKADNELTLSNYVHNSAWDNYKEDVGEIIMYTSNDFINTFDVLTFTLSACSDLGNYKIYLSRGKMIENDGYVTKTVEDKELVIKVTNNPVNSGTNKPTSDSSSTPSVKPSTGTNNNPSTEKTNSNSSNTNKSSSEVINSNKSNNNTNKNEINDNPHTGSTLTFITMIGMFAIAYSIWYYKKVKVKE